MYGIKTLAFFKNIKWNTDDKSVYKQKLCLSIDWEKER